MNDLEQAHYFMLPTYSCEICGIRVKIEEWNELWGQRRISEKGKAASFVPMPLGHHGCVTWINEMYNCCKIKLLTSRYLDPHLKWITN